MAGPATRFGTYKVTEWREGVQPQKTWIQKRIWKPRSSRFSSPTSIVCQGLVQTGLALHPMSRNRWSLKISSLKMFRLQCGLFSTQDVSPAVWGWRLLNARCFAYSCGMAPSCLPFEHCNINFSCHSNIALWSAILWHGALAQCTLTKRWGSNFGALDVQFFHHQIKGPPQYQRV